MYGENENSGINNNDINSNNSNNISSNNDSYTEPNQTFVDSTYRNVYYSDESGMGQSANRSAVNSSFYEDEPKKKKEKSGKGKKAVKFIAGAAAFGLIAGAAFYGVNAAANFIYPTQKEETKQVQLPVTVTNSSGNASGATMVLDVSDVVEEVMPSVVSVISRLSNEITYGPFSLGKQEYDASGSGIIVGQSDTELLIATNNHVIEDAETITVTFTDRTPENLTDDISVEALVKGTRSENDLAVIAVPLENIPDEVLGYIKIATLGDSDSLRMGEATIAIGNALGYGQSVTTGCVSALNRQVKIDNKELNMIQTDAAINQGNSGGALLNLKGEVIGINSAKYSSTGVEGMGYAIPISSVVDIINELMNRETRSIVDAKDRGYLGVKGIDITSDYAKAYGAPVGFSIQEIVEGGAAEKAGLQKYDIIVRVDGQTVEGYEDLSELLQYYKAGETVKVVVKYIENHEYVEREVELTLQKMSQ
ncbi:MAG: trypsin-like peptidase domain-containing protein [Lachnospiraceae bacterium]|nr:trypsin-like peptidase domain-containing protein [Lachnospiraceae bacterium]